MAKILVVDDEQKIREVIRKYAEVSGHEVTEAGDGMSAVRIFRIELYPTEFEKTPKKSIKRFLYQTLFGQK